MQITLGSSITILHIFADMYMYIVQRCGTKYIVVFKFQTLATLYVVFKKDSNSRGSSLALLSHGTVSLKPVSCALIKGPAFKYLNQALNWIEWYFNVHVCVYLYRVSQFCLQIVELLNNHKRKNLVLNRFYFTVINNQVGTYMQDKN